jgi:hypothetical protein
MLNGQTASMSVYFIKEWLREDFGWVRYDTPCKQKERRQKKPSYFYFIPGGYKDHEEVLQKGSQGMHYATSYIAIYNMVRRYGKFARGQDGKVIIVGYSCPSLP